MKKWFFSVLAMVVLAAAGFAYLQYHKAHRDTAAEVPAFVLSASALFQEYEENESLANEKYLDKLLLVKGTIASIKPADEGPVSISLQTNDPMFGISCELLPDEAQKVSALTEGESISIKGICTGKLMDVVLVRAVLVE